VKIVETIRMFDFAIALAIPAPRLLDKVEK